MGICVFFTVIKSRLYGYLRFRGFWNRQANGTSIILSRLTKDLVMCWLPM